MRRRDAIPAILLGAPGLSFSAIPPPSAGDSAAAVLLDVRTRALLEVRNADVASRLLALPGSTVKPFALRALLRLGRIAPRDAYACPGSLTIAGRSFNCSHPPMAKPMCIDTAIAYSCNCFTAHFAARLQPGELAAEFARDGLASPNGQIEPARTPDAIRLQALGEDSVRVTLMGLSTAYRTLGLHSDSVILAGLEGAVEYGTAQLAAVAGLKVAGKTGSVGAAGRRMAWFAGFAPSRSPEVVCAVLLHGQSGGGDAAPVAGQMLTAWRSTRRRP
jgi:penicillin-binding protein 2